MFHQPAPIDIAKEINFLLYFYTLASNQTSSYFSKEVQKDLLEAMSQKQGMSAKKLANAIKAIRDKPLTRKEFPGKQNSTVHIHHAIANALCALLPQFDGGDKLISDLQEALTKKELDYNYLLSSEKIDPQDLAKAKADYETALTKLCNLGHQPSVRKAFAASIEFHYSPITCEEFFNTFLDKQIKNTYPELKRKLMEFERFNAPGDAVTTINAAFDLNLSVTDALLSELSSLLTFGGKKSP